MHHEEDSLDVLLALALGFVSGCIVMITVLPFGEGWMP